MTAPAAGYDIAVVLPADYSALAAFLAGFPGLTGTGEFWLSRFGLWWDANPAFRPEAARGWMLRRRGEFCGFLANVPSLMLSKGRPVQVFSVSTWMVLPEHREASLDLLFRQVDAAKGTLLFDTTPTEAVAAILENLGFERISWGADRESFVLLRPAACLKARLPGLAWAPDAAWRAAGRLLEAAQGWKSGRLRPAPGLRVSEMREAGSAFDLLWEKTKGIYSLTNVRTSEVLRWHCFADRHVEKKLFACWSGGEAAGWCVGKVLSRRGLKTLEVVDFWADPSVPGVLESLLSFLVGYGSSGGYDLLTVGHFTPDFERSLRSAGLWEAPLKARRSLCLGLGKEAAFFTGLQGDYGTSP